MSVTIPEPGGPLRCGTAICGQAICGQPREPDSYIDFVLELDGVSGVIINPILLPFVCLDLDLAVITCTPLDPVSSPVGSLDPDPVTCEAA